MAEYSIKLRMQTRSPITEQEPLSPRLLPQLRLRLRLTQQGFRLGLRVMGLIMSLGHLADCHMCNSTGGRLA